MAGPATPAATVRPPGSPAAGTRPSRCRQPPPPHAGAADRALARQPGRRPARRTAVGPYSMCYAVSTGADPLGRVLPLRIPAAALPGLSAARDLARRLLRPDQHQRQPDFRHVATQKHACVADRARMLEGKPATRAVHHRRQRELPQQRRHRRQGASARGRAEHHDRRRRHAARQDLRGRQHRRVAVPRRLEGPVEDEDRRARRRSRSRRITTCAAASSRTACRSRAPSAGSTRRATRSWRASSTAASATTSRSSPCTR